MISVEREPSEIELTSFNMELLPVDGANSLSTTALNMVMLNPLSTFSGWVMAKGINRFKLTVPISPTRMSRTLCASTNCDPILDLQLT